MFQLSESFKAGIQLANGVPLDRFQLFLEQIIANIMKNERPFTESEQGKLQEVMGLPSADLHLLIDVCIFIYERAAVQSASASSLGRLLNEAGLSAAPLAAFQDVWKRKGPSLIYTFKEKSIGAPGCNDLTDVQWRVHLKVGDGKVKQVCEPSGILQIGLTSQDKEKKREEHFLVLELSHEQLFDLYEKLEQIQEQLDSLA